MRYKEKYAQFYNSSAWKGIRLKAWTRDNGLCQHCLVKGKVTEGKEVHHIESLEECWEKRLAIDNLVLLCSRCHNDEHERVSKIKRFNKMFDKIEIETEDVKK